MTACNAINFVGHYWGLKHGSGFDAKCKGTRFKFKHCRKEQVSQVEHDWGALVGFYQ